jgi:hypothetical protein
VKKNSTCLIVSVLILEAAGNPLSGGSWTWMERVSSRQMPPSSIPEAGQRHAAESGAG